MRSLCLPRGTGRSGRVCATSGEHPREAGLLLQMAASIGRLGAWSVELPAGVLTWSDEVCAIHEVPAGYQCSVAEVIHFYAPEYRAPLRAAYRACVRHGRPFDMELEIVTAQKRRVWVRAIGQAERDAEGRVIRVNGAFQDISRHKCAAEESRLLAVTLESMADSFYTLDREWRFTYLNHQAEQMLRRPRDQLLGRVIWEALPGVLPSAFHEHYQRAMAGDVPVEFEAFYPPLEIWVHLRACPSSHGLAVWLRDISERVRTQREILNLNAELEERVKQRTAELQLATREMEAFSYSVAHDLRAPLGAISGYSQALEEHEAASISPRARHFLKRIRVAARHMDEMTDGLLALARLSRAALCKEVVDLAPVAARTLALLAERDPQRDVQVQVMPDLWAEGDGVLLTQVMSNLLANAWKFTAGTGNARIEVGMKTGDDYEPVYYVRDNGAGFDMAYAGKLFKVFHRLHGSGEFEGTGVGLATVHKIIARHDGRIWAEAAPGLGATFYFTLGAPRAATA